MSVNFFNLKISKMWCKKIVRYSERSIYSSRVYLKQQACNFKGYSFVFCTSNLFHGYNLKLSIGSNKSLCKNLRNYSTMEDIEKGRELCLRLIKSRQKVSNCLSNLELNSNLSQSRSNNECNGLQMKTVIVEVTGKGRIVRNINGNQEALAEHLRIYNLNGNLDQLSSKNELIKMTYGTVSKLKNNSSCQAHKTVVNKVPSFRDVMNNIFKKNVCDTLEKNIFKEMDKRTCISMASALSAKVLAEHCSLTNRTATKIQRKSFSTFNRVSSILERSKTKSTEKLYKGCISTVSNTNELKVEKKMQSDIEQSLEENSIISNNQQPNNDSLNNEKNKLTKNSKVNPTMARFNLAPKAYLHNCFVALSNEFKDKSLQLSPKFKKVKLSKKENNLWHCTYNIKWPENLSFSSTSTSKKDASSKAALATLMWLYNNKKIDNKALPIIYDTKEVKSNIKLIPPLNIDKTSLKKLVEIKNIFDKELKECISSYEATTKVRNVFKDLDQEWPEFQNYVKPAYRNIDSYIIRNRSKLPISEYRKEIMQNLEKNRIIIIKGEPGCGKSTRVPQYILEEWASRKNIIEPCRIIVTQPRRIAAISLADRVANERGESVGKVVGYHIRLHSNFNKQTGRIMYCTAGILLRRLQSDPKLHDCTHIILDEVHERDIYIDLLMNLLKKTLELNENLKIVLMSASIDTTLFQNYFDNAPVLNIPGFTYPVKEHFIEEDSETFAKTLKMIKNDNPTVVCEDVVELINNINDKKPEGAILCFLPGWDEIYKVKEMLKNNGTISVLCLHSRMNIVDQKKVFFKAPPGIRKVILSTNIAETSVTINDIVYVIDTGIHKEQFFDAEKGMYCIGNHWISQSSMLQRKGRAGRVQAGESYHLYPNSLYKKFSKFSIPEILRTSLTKIVLDSKVVSNNMKAVDFLSKLPTPPDLKIIEKAVEELKELELLDENENLTPLGQTLSEFQMDPKLAKAMVNSVIFECVTPIVDITTWFSNGSELFSKGLIDKSGVKSSKMRFSENSDHLAFMRLFEKWLDHNESDGREISRRFSEAHGLMESKFQNIQKLREIHYGYLQKGLHNILPLSDNFSDNDNLVLGVLLSGVGTVLQYRKWDIVKGRFKKTKCFVTIGNSQRATITSESVNYKRTSYPSDYFLYLNEVLSNARRTILIRETSLISPLIVLLFKNKQLLVEEVPINTHIEDNPQNQVVLKLSGTSVKFICDKEEALLIKACKEALQCGVNYYISQMTIGGVKNEKVNKIWKSILINLNDILNKQTY